MSRTRGVWATAGAAGRRNRGRGVQGPVGLWLGSDPDPRVPPTTARTSPGSSVTGSTTSAPWSRRA